MSFPAKENDGVFLITCPAVIDGKDLKALEAEIKSWLLVSANVHILDFKDVTTFDPAAYRPFVLFNQSLKTNGKSLFVINMPATILPKIKQDGLTSVFVTVGSVEEARRRVAGGKPAVDVNFINPFIMAAKTVLETQAQTPLTPGKPYLKKAGEALPMEIAGVISLTCQQFKGTISICFQAAVFLKIYENMVGEKHTTISHEIEDAAGELLNIIFGQAKTVLNDQKGYDLEKALPTVLVGDKLKIHHQSRSPAIVLPFGSAAGNFHIEILVDQG